MRKMLFAVTVAAALGAIGVSGAGAVPADAMAVKEAATAAAPLKAQYVERRTRRGVVKCYRDLVVGPYRCHYYCDPL
jgi:hypothetical protein